MACDATRHAVLTHTPARTPRPARGRRRWGNAPRRCRHVEVVKNESQVSGKVDAYKKKRGALEDLADSWLSSLKKDKQPKRKQVTVNAKKGDERKVARWGEGKSKQDQMEYKIWELEESYCEAKEEGRRAEGMVRAKGPAYLVMRSHRRPRVSLACAFQMSADAASGCVVSSALKNLARRGSALVSAPELRGSRPADEHGGGAACRSRPRRSWCCAAG